MVCLLVRYPLNISGIRLAIFNSLFIFAKISGVTLLSSIFIAIILALLGTTIYVKVQSLMGKEGSTGFLQGGQLLGNEKLKRYYENLYVELNNGLQTLRKAALLTDPAFTGKIFAILFVCSNAAWHLGDFGFVWLAGNGYFTYPYVILFFGPQIRAQLKVVEDLIQSTLKKHKKD